MLLGFASISAKLALISTLLPALQTIPCYIRMAKKERKKQAKPAAVNIVFIAVCALWLSGLKRVYRLRPKCPDKIGAPECVVLRTLAAVYL